MIQIKEFFDKATFTLTYVVWDPATLDGVIIDPLLDYEPGGSIVSEESVTQVAAFVNRTQLTLHYILETHAHADHLSGSQYLKARYPQAILGIGARITEVQNVFKTIFDLDSLKTDGSQFDKLFQDGEQFQAGSLHFEVIYTPACSSYLIEDAVFTGDALFMPDYGVGRCDFPEGSSEKLFESVSKRLYSLPDKTRVFTCHDYQPGGRPLCFESTIGEQKRSNIQINAETEKAAFMKFRTERDKTLAAPRLLLPSIQVNIDAGRLPEPHRNGRSYLSIPITRKG